MLCGEEGKGWREGRVEGRGGGGKGWREGSGGKGGGWKAGGGGGGRGGKGVGWSMQMASGSVAIICKTVEDGC